MLMPALIPSQFVPFSELPSEEALFNTLIKDVASFIAFFDYACDDETWSQMHSEFMRKSLLWITSQSFQDNLRGELLEKAAKSIRQHYRNLYSFIPSNLIFKLADTSIEANSALYSAISPYFHSLIRRECFDKKIFKLDFLDISYAKLFKYVEEFVHTEEVGDLWRLEQTEIMSILSYALSIQLLGLSELCESILAKYLTPQNVYSALLMAHKRLLSKLKNACYALINAQNADVNLQLRSKEDLAFQFIHFSEQSMDVFEKLRTEITHLVFSDDQANQSGFGIVLSQCPKLEGIDLSHTFSYSDNFHRVSSDLKELSINGCDWLSAFYMKKIIEICPRLRKLFLISNVHLNVQFWGELMRMQHLKVLDISRCQQIRDEDFKIILHACSGLTSLSVEECRLLGEKAFYDLARISVRLQHLNVARTNISDASLIEIMSRCKLIEFLNLTRCERLTERGILEAVRNGYQLREISVTGCNLSKAALLELSQLRSQLYIIS